MVMNVARRCSTLVCWIGTARGQTRVLSSCVSWDRSMVAVGMPGVTAPSPGGVLVGGLGTMQDNYLFYDIGILV